jgi:Uma2 family endonuclease
MIPENSTTKTMSNHVSESAAIEYPDCDGEPIANNTLQWKWVVLIENNLEVVFRNDPQVFVAGDLLWYAVEGQPTIRTSPDAMVAFGRPKGYRGSYKLWEEGNISPQAVFEVLSPENRAIAFGFKFQFYQQFGVEEYYIYDPDDGFLGGWLREGSRLARVENMSGFISPRLQVRFEPGEGSDNLKIFRPDGKRFVTLAENVALKEAADRRADVNANSAVAHGKLADASRARTEVEEQLANASRARVEASNGVLYFKARADKLAAKLRELGIDPDSE